LQNLHSLYGYLIRWRVCSGQISAVFYTAYIEAAINSGAPRKQSAAIDKTLFLPKQVILAPGILIILQMNNAASFHYFKPCIMGFGFSLKSVVDSQYPISYCIPAFVFLQDGAFGKFKPAGKLPFELPSSMEAVRNQKEDVPYDSKDPLFKFGFGLRY
jgi:hypothetical protein